MATLVLDEDETKVERKVREVIMILLLHMTTTEPVLTVLTREHHHQTGLADTQPLSSFLS